jgi:uncharacterized protein (DUF1330 family)
MSAYVIVDIVVTDPTAYEQYKQLAAASIARHGGKYIARGGRTEVLEGDWAPNRIVILEFESVDRVKEWFDSPDYQEARRIRGPVSTAKLLVTEGL